MVEGLENIPKKLRKRKNVFNILLSHNPKSDLELINICDMMHISLDEVSMLEAKSSQQEMLL